MARYYFGDKDPIGGRFHFVVTSNSGITSAPDQAYTIIGVVGDAKYLDLREAPPRTIYLSAFQEPRMFANELALKTTGRPVAVTDEVRRIVRDELKAAAVTRVATMDDLVDASVVSERVIAALSSFFGALGALLAAPLATAAMLAIALVAAYVPTRRAARVEPIGALRQ